MDTANSASKYFRLIEMYLRLVDGEVLKKQDEAERYGIHPRSVQRDLDGLRLFLEGQETKGFSQTIVYDRKRQGYTLQGSKKDLSREEALALCKILLESRAFTKAEMSGVVDKIIRSGVPRGDIGPVLQLVNNEKQNYEELQHHDAALLGKIWRVGSAINSHKTLKLRYAKKDGREVCRLVKPLSVMFSEFYFYLIAEFARPEDVGLTGTRYRFPTVFRLDRIRSFEEGQPFKIDYGQRFKSGEVRKRIQYMYGGDLHQVRIAYTGAAADYILDRFPTAVVRSEEDLGNGLRRYTITMEVYGLIGIRIWLLSQGAQVKVLAPDTLAAAVRENLRQALAQYEPMPEGGHTGSPERER